MSDDLAFGDGSRDARDGRELAIQQPFFDINQLKGIKEFVIKLTITMTTSTKKNVTGTSYLNIKINNPPQDGVCDIKIARLDQAGKSTWTLAKTGRALLDEFFIQCRDWVDKDGHTINKYIFKSKPVYNMEP